MKVIKGFKFIQSNMKSKNGNHLWVIGKWYKHEGKLKLCEKGFHACLTPRQSFEYIYGDKWFIVEARGKTIEAKGDKFVASEMRLIKEIPIMVLKKWALWNAKQCLKNYESWDKEDKRVSDCIRVCEDFLDGKATIEQLNAAWSAARSARSAAWSAARSARSAAESARSAAESAARSAAESAARSADKVLLRLIKEYTK